MSNEQVRPNLKYTRDHEWAEIDGDIATIGITHYAQESLGDIVFVELPEVGDTIEAGGEFAVVESVKAASEIYSPISGDIVEINEELNDAPETINSDPYDDGWIVKVKMSDTSELSDALDAEEYAAYVKELD